MNITCFHDKWKMILKLSNFFLISFGLLLKQVFFVNHTLWNGILLPELFWPTVRENYSSDQEKLLKFEAEGPEFLKFLIIIQIGKNYWDLEICRKS